MTRSGWARSSSSAATSTPITATAFRTSWTSIRASATGAISSTWSRPRTAAGCASSSTSSSTTRARTGSIRRGRRGASSRPPTSPGRHPFGSWRGARRRRACRRSRGPRTASGRPSCRTRSTTRGRARATSAPATSTTRRPSTSAPTSSTCATSSSPRAALLADLARCYKYWIALTDCDGFRIDTLKHVSLRGGAELLRHHQGVRRQPRQERLLPGRRGRRRRLRRGPLSRRARSAT